jgi:hypothetical protein
MRKNRQKIYKQNDTVISRKIAGEIILVPIRGKLADMRRIFTLNPVAEYIWDWIDGENSIQTIENNIVSAFDVTHEAAARDLDEFVTVLLQENLIIEIA